MYRTRSKLEGVSEGLFWLGVVLGVASPFVLFLGAAATGAGHGTYAIYYAGFAVSGFAWLAFLASLVAAVAVSRHQELGLWPLLLPALGVIVYPFAWYYIFRMIFS
jgi:hypothetical protein